MAYGGRGGRTGSYVCAISSALTPRTAHTSNWPAGVSALTGQSRRRSACRCSPRLRAGGRCTRTADSRSGGVFHGSLGVGATARGCPLVPARLRLRDAPPLGLFHFVAAPASGAGVARACPSAFVVGDGVFEVRVAGWAGAAGEGALAVADLDEVAEQVAGLVAV